MPSILLSNCQKLFRLIYVIGEKTGVNHIFNALSYLPHIHGHRFTSITLMEGAWWTFQGRRTTPTWVHEMSNTWDGVTLALL